MTGEHHVAKLFVGAQLVEGRLIKELKRDFVQKLGTGIVVLEAELVVRHQDRVLILWVLDFEVNTVMPACNLDTTQCRQRILRHWFKP